MAFSVPFSRDEQFLGRLSILESLEGDSGVTVLYGRSGVGKTHIAVEHAYRHKAIRPSATVIWLSSHGFWRLDWSVKHFAGGLRKSNAEISGLSSFILWFTREHHDQWLLILDDVSLESFPQHEKNVLLHFVANHKPKFGRILLTTKVVSEILLGSDASSASIQLIHVARFSEVESHMFLNARRPKASWTDKEQKLLVEIGCNSPSALQFLTTFWQQSKAADDEKQTWEAFKDRIRGQPAGHALEVALSMAVDQVEVESVESYEMLCALSLLDTQGVPLPLLSACWSGSRDLKTLRLRRGLRKLLSFSLVRCSNDGVQCFMDDPTREYTQKRLEQRGALIDSQQRVVEALAQVFKPAPGLLRTCHHFIPHVRLALKYKMNNKNINVNASRSKLFHELGKFSMVLSAYDDAHTQLQRALNIRTEMYGERDLRTLEIEEEVASALFGEDKLIEAAALHERIETIYREILPPDHYRLLIHSGQYGQVFLEQRNWPEAERRLFDGLKGLQKIYNESNGRVLSAKSDIARLYFMMDRYEEAQAGYEDLLKQYRLQYEDTDHHVFQTISWIARILMALKKPKESVEKYREAYNLASRSPETTVELVLNARNNLAVALSGTGNLSEAAALQGELLDSYKLLDARPSLRAINAAQNYGVTLERLSRYDEARKALEWAKAELDLAALPPTHDSTLRVRNALALVYLRLGHFSSGEKAYRDLLKTQQDLHKDDPAHPDILLVKNNLAGALQRQERYPEAIAIQQEVLDSATAKLGAGCRTALFAGTNLAESFRMYAEAGAEDGPGLLDKAEKLHRAVLSERETQLGEVWPTWTSRINIGMVLQAKGRLDDAAGWYNDLGRLEQAVGDGNWTVKVGREKQAQLLARLGEERGCLTWSERVIPALMGHDNTVD